MTIFLVFWPKTRPKKAKNGPFWHYFTPKILLILNMKVKESFVDVAILKTIIKERKIIWHPFAYLPDLICAPRFAKLTCKV